MANPLQLLAKAGVSETQARESTPAFRSEAKIGREEKTSFADTLKAEQTKAQTPEVKKEVEIMGERLAELKEKVAIMEKQISPESPEAKMLAELKNLIQTLETLLQGAGKKGEKLPEMQNLQETLASMNAMMADILALLKDPAKLQSMLDTLNTKIQGLKKQTESLNGKTAQAAELKPAIQASGEENKPRLTVIDRRTTEAETTPMKSASIAGGSKTSSDTIAQTTVKAAARELKTPMETQAPSAQKENLPSAAQNMHTDFVAAKAAEAPVAQKAYTSFASAVSKVNIEALLQGVTGKALVTLADGKSEMKMNLNPPELGRMNLKLTLEDGIMAGKIVVSTPEAKALFDQNLGELQRALQQAGINLGSLDVALGNNGFSGSQDSAEPSQTGGIAANAAVSTTETAVEQDAAERWWLDSSINFVA